MGDQPLSSPRHRRHGGPLPRRPANVTRANPSPTYLYLPEDASQQSHGALGRISPGYCICIATNPLPLDLHVLSLPLAFILSQDQTLHCICSIYLSLSCITLISKKLTLLFSWYFACTCSSIFQSTFGLPRHTLNLSSFILHRVSFSKAGAKIWRLFLSSKFFCNFFLKIF